MRSFDIRFGPPIIRPVTMICWILALGSGLYLYRAKHEVELMDKQIDQIAKETNDIRAESRHLLDDWIRLGDPEQLRKYSDEYLGLKAIAPAQFTRLSDLASRLPPPQADPPPAAQEMTSEPAAVPPAEAGTDNVNEADANELPVPPIPPPVNSVSLPAVTAVPLQARPVTPRVASEPKPHPIDAHVADEPRQSQPKPPSVAATEPRSAGQPQSSIQQNVARAQEPVSTREPPRGRDVPWPPRAEGLPPLQAQGPGQDPGGRSAVARSAVEPPVATARASQPRASGPPAMPVAQSGSLLGMSHGSVPLPLPAPTPVNATWNGQGGR
jgi:hypothetical protein